MSNTHSYTELPEPMPLIPEVSEPSRLTSLYIPTLSDDLTLNGFPFCTPEYITHFFEKLYNFGTVSRVDIATRPVGSGYIKCAFIHFSKWSEWGEMYKETLLLEGKLRFDYAYMNTNGVSMKHWFYSPSMGEYRYIVVKLNRTPIPEIAPLAVEKMNVHQLVDNYKRLEIQLAEATKLAKDRLTQINTLTEELASARELNHQLFAENEQHENKMESLHCCHLDCNLNGFPWCRTYPDEDDIAQMED